MQNDKNINAMRARNARLRMHQLLRVHVISKTEREKEGKRQSIRYRREHSNSCAHLSPCAGCTPLVWEGVVPRSAGA